MTLIYLILYFLMPNLLKVLFIVLNLTCGSPHWGSKEPWGETSARYTWRHLVQSLSHWLCPLSLEGDPVFSFFKQISIIMCCIPYCIQLIFIHYLSLRNWEARLYIKSMCHTSCTTSIVLNDSSFPVWHLWQSSGSSSTRVFSPSDLDKHFLLCLSSDYSMIIAFRKKILTWLKTECLRQLSNDELVSIHSYLIFVKEGNLY